MELFRIKNDIPFMSYGRLTTAISLVTFILAIVFLATRGLNFGVDFTGGTVMEVNYPKAANLESVRKAIDNGTLSGSVTDASLVFELKVPLSQLTLKGFFFAAQVSDSQGKPQTKTALFIIPTVPVGG